MIKLNTKRSRIAFSFGIALLCIAVIFFLLRGPYLSNFTKRLIIPTLENATRERVIIGQAAINLFPFYVQAKSVKVFDEDGNQHLWITKSRAYIDLFGLFSKEVRIRKFWLKEPRLKISSEALDKIIQNVNNYVSKGEESDFEVTLYNVEVTDGELELEGMQKGQSFSGSGMSLNMTVKNYSSQKKTTASLVFEEAKIKFPELSEISGSLEGSVKIENGRVEIADLNVRSSESTIDLEGEVFLTPDGRLKEGVLNGKAMIQVSTFSELFGLEHENDGELYLEGKIGMVPGKDSSWPLFDLDLETVSRFHLETLMDIIDVEETVAGLVFVKGDIKGRFPDIVGKGSATLKNALFDTLPLDDVAGEIEYKNMRFTLNKFVAHTYHGELAGYAHLDLPDGDYVVAADASGVSSPELFRYIGWEPPFPAGRVNAQFSLNQELDSDFEITADINYLNETINSGDVMSRLRSISTSLDLKGDKLTFVDTVFSTSLSTLFLKGAMDLEKETLSFDLRLETEDGSDLTAPYYTKLEAPLIFKGTAAGPLTSPEISGRLDMDAGKVSDIPVSVAFAEFKYTADLLAVEKLMVRQNGAFCDLSGNIEFRETEGFFSFKAPFYSAKASLNDARIDQFAEFFSGDVPVDGIASGTITFEGDTDKFNGTSDLVISNAVVHGQDIAKAELKATFGPDSIKLHPLDAYQGRSRLTVEGIVSYDGKFDLALSSEDFDTCDINMIEDHPLGVRFNSIKINGSGTTVDPDIKFTGHILESYLNEKEIGTGDIEGTLKGRDIQFKGLFVDGLVSADARASLAETNTWNADIDIKRGRYDFLLGLIDKVPDDSLLSLKGVINVRSTGEGHTVRSRFDYLGLRVLGYDLINDKDVVLDIVNRELFIKSLSLTGDNTDVYASGSLKFNENYDVELSGNIDIKPFSEISEKIGSLKGQGAYIMNIKGEWASPEINGEIKVNDATAVLTDMAYKVGPVNGVFIFEKDKVTFDSVRTNFAGGTVDISGVGYLNNLSVQKLYLSASLNDIKIRPLERVSVALGGDLFYETSPEGASFTGYIDINKAKYEKDVEFDKLILGLKEMEGKKVQYPDFIKKTALNIHVEGQEDILIDNNIATTPVKISLNLMGTVQQYGLIGRVEALEGNIYFRNNEFNILKGSSVEFISPEGMVPVFHILADSYVSDYYVKLTLDGTMDQFNLTLFSDPPLSEMDILALLTFGQFTKESRGFESGLAASEAASLLTGDLQEAVASKFRNLTGFERFEIEPHAAATGSLVPKVTIGKRLIENRLSVIYSTSVGTTEENIIKLKYNINKSVSIIGSRDEIGSAGVDLKYKFEFK